jgi:hypothetical protein
MDPNKDVNWFLNTGRTSELCQGTCSNDDYENGPPLTDTILFHSQQDS